MPKLIFSLCEYFSRINSVGTDKPVNEMGRISTRMTSRNKERLKKINENQQKVIKPKTKKKKKIISKKMVKLL